QAELVGAEAPVEELDLGLGLERVAHERILGHAIGPDGARRGGKALLVRAPVLHRQTLERGARPAKTSQRGLEEEGEHALREQQEGEQGEQRDRELLHPARARSAPTRVSNGLALVHTPKAARARTAAVRHSSRRALMRRS